MVTTLGTVLLSLAEISGEPGGHGFEALGAALLCRAAAALMMVSLRSPGDDMEMIWRCPEIGGIGVPPKLSLITHS